MKYSNDGLKLTERFESCRLKAYLDTGGVPTIGYGHTRGVKLGDTCTQEQAEEWLRQDVQVAEDAVNKFTKVELTQGQFDALVDFTFNVGVAAFLHSTLLKKLNSGDYKGAEAELDRWVKDNGKVLAGLQKRRDAEQELFD